MPFLGVLVLMTGLWDLKDILNSPQNRSKNKLVSENAMTQAHGNCSLRVMWSYGVKIPHDIAFIRSTLKGVQRWWVS